MSSITVTQDRDGREGLPLVFSLTDTVVLVLVAVALIATAAIPAVVRHPHVAEAKTVAAAPIRP